MDFNKKFEDLTIIKSQLSYLSSLRVRCGLRRQNSSVGEATASHRLSRGFAAVYHLTKVPEKVDENRILRGIL